MAKVNTGVAAHDKTCFAAEQVYQNAITPSTTQTAANAAALVYYKAVKASAIANGLTGELGSPNLEILQLGGTP